MRMGKKHELHAKDALINIMNKATQAQSNAQKCLAVFDLDSTLFDVTPRIEKILQNFIREPEIQSRFPANCKAIKEVEIYRTDWGIRDALIRAGLDGHSPDFHEVIKTYWRKHFFSNEYLHYDSVYDGAVEYVTALYERQVDIVYLTGRDVARLGRGTIDVLNKWNFPMDPTHAQTILKPHMDMDDAQFKSDYFATLPDGKYEYIWLFENEPTNIRVVRKEHSHIEVIFFDSTHSGLHEAPVDLPKIMHYLLD
jgi:hypothetical protein